MLPPGYVERAARLEDLGAVTDLLIASDIAEFGEPDWSEDDQVEEWANPRLDLAVDTRVVHAAGGATVGYAIVTCRDQAVDGTGTDFDSDVYVHPDHDASGIEEHLMGFVEDRAREQIAPGVGSAQVVAVVHAANTVRAARYLAAGYAPVRHFWRMTIALPAAPSDHSPRGVTIRPYAGLHELPDVHRVVTEAFHGHFRHVPLPYDEWAARYAHREVSTGPWLLAEMDGQVVGALLSSSSVPGAGWIRYVSVLESARGRGIGLGLLQRAFDAFADLGATKVSLGVDAENATGAVGLYQRAGMAVERQHDFYAKSLQRVGVPIT
ncbi:MAG TPA: GNAT family N-acetyltransferase [Mycobacteriales bacterium]|nr:GNAT family N-acetyltransferase [Mycobacteriales bacterium]